MDLCDLVGNPAELNNQLLYFYASVRQKNGEELKKKSLDSLKYGISKHLLSTYKINLKDQQFSSSNETYKSKVKQLKRSGHGSVDHKPVISDSDLEKLSGNSVPFNINTPCGLQNRVWFNLMYCLLRRGQENLRSMTKSTFAIATDSTGRKFIHQVIAESTKNHGIADMPDDTTGKGNIYEQPGSTFCPVRCFEKYLSKLNPKLEALWQRPLESFQETSNIWYCAAPLGKNTLSGMMSSISRQAGLSKVYTNHCLRATSITKLDRHGFEARHIMRASGHKSEASIRSYSTHLSEDQQRDMSDCLSKPFSNKNDNATVKSDNDMNELSEQDLLNIFSDDNSFEDLLHVTNNDSIQNAVPVVSNQNVLPVVSNHSASPVISNQSALPVVSSPNVVQQQVIQQSYNRLTDIHRTAPQFTFSNCQVHFHYH
ncbi:zinc finger MYM-type protein 2-like [Dreissena polymorpha]|uniref:zinc finger MYM-type protein 2-like n=1 Tax=Dreissena polymorpha TaxID=45954 RepID=UPI0022643659|nr:zinc finger MYM-type protein 2-like [Dreissena polymorpha]